MNAKTFHLSAQGSSHIKKDKECQDCSASYQDEECAIAIVCDGHGGDDYFRSAIGSLFACETAENNIKEFIKSLSRDEFFSDPEGNLRKLKASIISGWNDAVTKYHSEHPFLDSELTGLSEKTRKKYVESERIESAYGTTLIAVAMNKSYWFGIHIGDGKCVAINPEGEFKQPIPWDPKCFLNATTSICDSDAIDRFRHFYSEKLPAAVFVGSDGIDDCFNNNDQLHNLYKTVVYSFATTEFEEAYEGLKDYLPRLSAKGSGDDVSIAAILDLDLIPELPMVKEYDIEKEKARVKENARLEAEKNEAEKRRVEEEHSRFQQLNNSKAVRKGPSTDFVICKMCGEKNKLGAKFCSDCGTKLIGDVDVVKVSPFSSGPEAEQSTSEELIEKDTVISTTDLSEQEDDRVESEVIIQSTLDFPNSSVDSQETSEEDSSQKIDEVCENDCCQEGELEAPKETTCDSVSEHTESDEETDNSDTVKEEKNNEG